MAYTEYDVEVSYHEPSASKHRAFVHIVCRSTTNPQDVFADMKIACRPMDKQAAQRAAEKFHEFFAHVVGAPTVAQIGGQQFRHDP